MAGQFARITLKGDRADRSLMLSVVGLVEQDLRPVKGDGWEVIGVRMGGRMFRARITKRSIVVTPN